MPINSGVQFETSSQKNKISGVGISYETTDAHITIGYGAPKINLSNPSNNTYLDLSNIGLNVQGTSSNSRLTSNSLDISNNGLFSINNNCYVGIGTNNPSAHLEVLGDISFNGSLTKNGVEVGTINDGELTIAKTNGLQIALNAKQATITDGDLTIARTSGLQAALDAKQATITDGDLTIARTSGLQAAIDAKQATITDGDLTIARTSGLQAALDAKQATVTFNAPSSNNTNPSTSAQIQTALDTKQATINDGDLTIARTSGLQAALDAKQDTITFNAPSSNNGNPSTSAQIQTALDAKEDALTFNAPSSNNSNPSTSAQIKAALDTKQDTLTFNAPSSNNGNPSTSAQIKTALDTKQATIGDGDLTIARTSGLQAALDAKAPLSNAQLTGIPTAPTAVKTTNTTQVATTEFVQTKITDLVNTAPGALDTLGEIATALNNDNDFAATMTTQLAGKQATLTFNAPSSNNGNPSTSAQIKAALDTKQNTISDGDLSIARTSGLQAALDGKQATIADGDLTIAKTSGLQTALDGKQATIGDDDLTIARTSGLQSALDAKQAILTFNAPSSDNGNPSTSAQIKAALDTKQNTITDGDLTIARTTGLQAALDAKQASITYNAPSSNNGNPSTSAQIKSALDAKQDTIGDGDLTIARTSGLQAALDAKQATITDGDLTIARTTGLQSALDAKAPLSNAQLTGVPTAPTAASSVNTTQVATTAFVQTKITDLIGAAPAALDTLKEIGDALGNDADFASTMTTQLSGKQATLTFNAPSSNNGNPSTSAQIKTALDAKQATIGDDDLTIAHTSGLQAALDAKQATLTFNAPSSDNTNPSTSAQIKAALDSKQATIGDGDLTIARTSGLQAALDAKQATLTFNAPSSNNTNPSTSAQIKTALDSKQDTIGDGDLTIARTNGLQTAIDGKQATIGDGDLTIARTNGLQAALDGKQATIGDGDLTIAKTSGLQTAIDGKQATLTFNAPSSDNTNPSTSAQIKTALDAKQATIGDGDLTIARTSGLQAALDAKAPLSNAQLTGVPTAPTAASSVNTTQVATTAFVQTKITDLIGAAPAALDTLKEIGDALGNDADFASTITTQLSGKQATLTFNDPSYNNTNPSTSAQIKAALDTKQNTISDGDLTIARTSGLQSALDGKQSTIGDGDLTIARTSGLQSALDGKQSTIGDGDLTIARTSGLQTALDSKQSTIGDGDLTIARTNGLQATLDSLSSSGSGAWTTSSSNIYRNTGNVGIGTTTPNYKLDVVGTTRFTEKILVGTTVGNSTSKDWHNAHLYIGGVFNQEYNTSSTYKLVIAGSDNDATGNYPIYVIDENEIPLFYIQQQSSHRPNTYYRGKIGIGDSPFTPSKTLDVQGDINFTGNLYQSGSLFSGSGGAFQTSGSNAYYNSGNVGIGTTTPNALLHLKSAGDVVLKLEADTDNSGETDNPLIHLSQDGGARQAKIGITSTNDTDFTGSLSNVLFFDTVSQATTEGIQFATNGTVKMTILEPGNVGIGTTTTYQNSKLHVKGDCVLQGQCKVADPTDQTYQLISGAGSNNSYLSTIKQGVGWGTTPLAIQHGGGNVGIGTTSPNEKLHVYDSGSICSLLVSNGSSGDQPKEGVRITSRSTSSGNGHGAIEFIENHINNGPMDYGFAMGYAGSGASNPTNYAWQDNHFCITRFHNSTNGSLVLKISRDNDNLYAQGAVYASGSALTSDSRIKTDISDIDDTLALQKVNAIENKEYHYIDPKKKNEMKTIGFMAQQVKEVLPNAVSLETGWIPDEMRKIENPVWIDCSYSSIRYESKITYTESITYEEGPMTDSFGNPVLDQSGNQIIDPSAVEIVDPSGVEHIDPSGIVIEEWHEQWKLQITDLDITNDKYTGNVRFSVDDNINGNNTSNIDITCVKDDSNNNTQEFKFEKKYPYVFLWGKEVNDFHYLDKNQIFALHHSAIQELSRENSALKAKVASLETDMAAVKANLGL